MPLGTDSVKSPPRPTATDLLTRLNPKAVNFIGTTIDPRKPKGTAVPQAKRFPAAHLPQWLADNSGKDNLYLYGAMVKPGVTKPYKYAETDMAASCALWVDCDPQGGDRFWPSRDEILEKLRAHQPPPSCVMDSGNGFQAYWFLKQPIGFGNAKDFQDWKLRNQKLANDLGDHCFSAEHLLRMPDAINVLIEHKAKEKEYPLGDRMARIVDWNPEREYSLAQFEPAAAAAEAPKAKATGPAFKDTGDYDHIKPDDPRLEELEAKWITLGTKGASIHDKRYRNASGVLDRSRASVGFIAACIRAKIDDHVIASILMDPEWAIGEYVREPGGRAAKRRLERDMERGHKYTDEDLSKPPVLGYDTWRPTADSFHFRVSEHLLFHNGLFCDYATADGAYRVLEKMAVQSMAGNFLHSAKRWVFEKESQTSVLKPFNPNTSDITELVNELGRYGYKDRDSMTPPCWINEAEGPPAKECLVVRNGILHVPTRELTPTTPDFFTLNALTFKYIEDAECVLWLKTIGQWFPRDADGKPSPEELLLQEIFGYLLTPWTNLQKIFLLLGPGGSGKGTIMRLIRLLIGERNCAAPTVSTVLDTFGKHALIGKLVALMSEPAYSDRSESARFTALLKEISGEDKTTVNRKNKDEWDGQLDTRFVIACNKMLRFADDSTAFTDRLEVLKFFKGFRNTEAEDPNLSSKLAKELPGILNWALVGYDRLKANGHFTETAAGDVVVENVLRAASPANAFVKDCCELEADVSTTEKELFHAFNQWSIDNGERPELRQGELIEGIMAGNINLKQKRLDKPVRPGGEKRPRCLVGIRLLDPGSLPLEKPGGDRPTPPPPRDDEIPF